MKMGENSTNGMYVLSALVAGGIVTAAAALSLSSSSSSTKKTKGNQDDRAMMDDHDEPTYEYELWDEKVRLGIYPDGEFPTTDELKAMEDTMPGCRHGWFESVVERKRLHYRQILPPSHSNPKAIVIFHHGIQTHSGASFVVPSSSPSNDEEDDEDDDDDAQNKTTTKKKTRLGLSKQIEVYVERENFALYAMDQLGHGYSEGTRRYMSDYRHAVLDLANFVRLVSSKHPGVPVFCTGHSFGGTLCLLVAKMFQNDDDDGGGGGGHPKPPEGWGGIAVAAPAIVSDMPPPPVTYLLRNVLAPRYPAWTPFFMPNTLQPERIWRDAEARRANTDARYKSMKIDCAGVKLRLGTAVQCLCALEEVRSHVLPALNTPVCAVHGTDDYGVPSEGTDLLEQRAQSKIKFVRKIPGAYHDLFCDPSADEVLDYITEFIHFTIDAAAGEVGGKE